MLYNTKVADPIHYKNTIIWQATKKIRYYTYTNTGILKSDTLQGIKKLLNK